MKIESRTSASVIRSATFIDEKDIGIIDCVDQVFLGYKASTAIWDGLGVSLLSSLVDAFVSRLQASKTGRKLKERKESERKRQKKLILKAKNEIRKHWRQASCVWRPFHDGLFSFALQSYPQWSKVDERQFLAETKKSYPKLSLIQSAQHSLSEIRNEKKKQHNISRKLYSYKYVCQMITREYSFSIWIWSYASIWIKLPSAKKYLLLRWETYLGFC